MFVSSLLHHKYDRIKIDITVDIDIMDWAVYLQLLRRKPCYHRENHAMPMKISIRIEFYNKSIMERLHMLNMATLSTRAHLAPNPA